MRDATRVGRRLALLAVLAGVFAALPPGVASAQQQPTLSVTSTADDRDAHPGDGTCAAKPLTSGTWTLRAAIMEANARPGKDTIVVALGRAAATIAPRTPLPQLRGPVVHGATTHRLFRTKPLRAGWS